MLDCPIVILVVFNKVLGSGSFYVEFECSPPHLLKDNVSCLWGQCPPIDQTHARLGLWRISPQWHCVSERRVCCVMAW